MACFLCKGDVETDDVGFFEKRGQVHPLDPGFGLGRGPGRQGRVDHLLRPAGEPELARFWLERGRVFDGLVPGLPKGRLSSIFNILLGELSLKGA